MVLGKTFECGKYIQEKTKLFNKSTDGYEFPVKMSAIVVHSSARTATTTHLNHIYG